MWFQWAKEPALLGQVQVRDDIGRHDVGRQQDAGAPLSLVDGRVAAARAGILLVGRLHLLEGKALPMPCRWYFGNTDTGPSPYQFRVPSETAKGENATCPTTRPFASATRDTVKALAARRAPMMNSSVRRFSP
jgi:hypothetical protein